MDKLQFGPFLFCCLVAFLKGVFNLSQRMEEMMMMSVCVKFPHLASCPGQTDGENGASATRCPPITIIQTHTPMIIGTRMMMMMIISCLRFFCYLSKPRYKCRWSYILLLLKFNSIYQVVLLQAMLNSSCPSTGLSGYQSGSQNSATTVY